MATLADKYYIKALEEYEWNLEDAMENLHYALSYDPQHAGANYLSGVISMKSLDEYAEAEAYFEAALASNPTYLKAIADYALLAIWLRDYAKAEKLINYAYKLKGVKVAEMLYLEALMHEYKKCYDKATALLEAAMEETYNKDYMDFLDEAYERVQRKSAKKGGYTIKLV